MIDINCLYDEVKKQLQDEDNWDEALSQIKDCTSNQARTQCLSKFKCIQKQFKFSPSSKCKSVELSVKSRNDGNNFFQKGEYQKALDKYNQSVLLAPVHSESKELKGNNLELAYAVANRSAVFFRQKNYDLCLEDIDLAIKNDYPKALIYKLYERKAKCFAELGEYQKAIESFRLAIEFLSNSELEEKKLENIQSSIEKQIKMVEKKGSDLTSRMKVMSRNQFHRPLPVIEKRSDKFPCASDAVGITKSENAEFGLTATRDILVGEAIIIEKPYTSIVLPKFDATYCHHCCKRVISVYPCHSCSEVVYCSSSCYRESWEEYHNLECVCLGTVKKANLGLGYLAFKMVLKAGLTTILQYKSQEQMDGYERKVGFNENGVYDSESYHSVYCLVNHSEKRSPDDLFKRSLHAYFLLRCLEKTSFLTANGSNVSFEDKCYVAGHFLRHIMMLPCNAHEVSELALKPECLPESETKEIGSAIYPVLSLINHSCDPNVVRHSYGNICVVRAIKNIAEGEEIVDNYGALYPLTVRSERRSTLQHQYYFSCNCQACENDWPLYFNIPSDLPKFKCHRCSGPVVVPLDKKTENSFCITCKQKQDTTDVIVKLHQSDYQSHLEQVLRGEKLQEALPKLEEHLQFLYKTVCLPWQDCNNCQEAIKQCYAVQASCYITT